MNLAKIINLENLKQLVKYGLSGGLSSALDLGIFFTLNELVHIPYYYVTPISFSFGAIANYFLQRKFTFENKYLKKGKQFAFFFCYAVLGLVINWILIIFLVEGFGLWPTLAKAIVIPLVGLINFLVHKTITFGLMK
jgi:putative flippase GtrA